MADKDHDLLEFFKTEIKVKTEEVGHALVDLSDVSECDNLVASRSSSFAFEQMRKRNEEDRAARETAQKERNLKIESLKAVATEAYKNIAGNTALQEEPLTYHGTIPDRIYVILDGDEAIFAAELLKRGVDGGRDAAKQLLEGVHSYLEDAWPLVVDLSCTVIVHIFLDVGGLADDLTSKGVIATQGDLLAFLHAFSSTNLLFFFTDVGSNKQLASRKVHEMLGLTAPLLDCQLVIAGPCSSSELHLDFMRSLAQDQVALRKTVLLETTQSPYTLRSLGFNHLRLRRLLIPRLELTGDVSPVNWFLPSSYASENKRVVTPEEIYELSRFAVLSGTGQLRREGEVAAIQEDVGDGLIQLGEQRELAQTSTRLQPYEISQGNSSNDESFLVPERGSNWNIFNRDGTLVRDSSPTGLTTLPSRQSIHEAVQSPLTQTLPTFRPVENHAAQRSAIREKEALDKKLAGLQSYEEQRETPRISKYVDRPTYRDFLSGLQHPKPAQETQENEPFNTGELVPVEVAMETKEATSAPLPLKISSEAELSRYSYQGPWYEVNARGQRVDHHPLIHVLPSWEEGYRQKIAALRGNMKPCAGHHAGGGCPHPRRCKRVHGELKLDLVERVVMQQTKTFSKPCKMQSGCKEWRCPFGHHCRALPGNCPAGSTCPFMATHGMDIRPASRVAHDGRKIPFQK